MLMTFWNMLAVKCLIENNLNKMGSLSSSDSLGVMIFLTFKFQSSVIAIYCYHSSDLFLAVKTTRIKIGAQLKH